MISSSIVATLASYKDLIDDKDPFIKAICLHYTYFLPHAELQQLQKGFRETLQMELLVCLYPDEIRALLVASSLYDVKASFFRDHCCSVF